MASTQHMPYIHYRSLATARRLCGRLLVVGALWALWPGASAGAAAAAVCVCLAAGCAVAAVLRHEPIRDTELNRWFEAFILVIVAALIFDLS
jgi:hypothetical protein